MGNLSKTKRIIAVIQQKGGVSKTTSTYNIAASAVALGKRVLIADIDPQSNESKTLGVENENAIKKIFRKEPVTPVKTLCKNIDLLPTDKSLSSLIPELISDIDLQYHLREYMETLTDYDLILIDTPPTAGCFISVAGITADYFIVPISSSYYTLQGTQDVMESMQKIRRRLNPELEFLGAFISMYDKRITVDREIASEAREYFGAKLFDTYISKTVKVEESVIAKKPVIELFPNSEITSQYMSLTKEILMRVQEADR